MQPTYEVKAKKSLLGWRYYVAEIDNDIQDYPKLYTNSDMAHAMCELANCQHEVQIITKYDPPPIPVRDMDFAAWIDGQEENGTGRGATEEQAIANLLESIIV